MGRRGPLPKSAAELAATGSWLAKKRKVEEESRVRIIDGIRAAISQSMRSVGTIAGELRIDAERIDSFLGGNDDALSLPEADRILWTEDVILVSDNDTKNARRFPHDD